jgi:hypothetical protein
MNETGRKIKEQYADTGGFTDHVFAVTALLGFQFIPRIRDLPSKRLYVFDPANTPKELKVRRLFLDRSTSGPVSGPHRLEGYMAYPENAPGWPMLQPVFA